MHLFQTELSFLVVKSLLVYMYKYCTVVRVLINTREKSIAIPVDPGPK
jgi:hypothetical protein